MYGRVSVSYFLLKPSMNELINQITSRTGISEAQAQEAVKMALSFVKTKLPEPMAAQLDNYLAVDAAGGMVNQVQQQLGNLGGMFGGK